MPRWWETPEHEWNWWTWVRYVVSSAPDFLAEKLSRHDPKRRY